MSTGIAEPPPAPAATAAPIPEVSSPPPGGAQGVQRLPNSTVVPPPVTALPRSSQPGSALDKARQRLQAKAEGKEPPKEPAKPAEPAKPTEAPEPEAPAAAPSEDDELLGEEKVAVGKSQPLKEGAAEPSKGKVNPWKLLDETKSRAAALEKEVAEVRKLVPNAEIRKQEMAELEAARKRSKELEEHIKYVDYQMSTEYKEKYEQPYARQWQTSMKELKGVTAQSEDGLGGREIAPQDLLDLVNMPLARAKVAAMEAFGDFAPDVMAHRQKIRELFDARTEALDKARTEGTERAEKMTREQTEKLSALSSEVEKTYRAAVESFESNPKFAEYFKPIDGDDEANAMLNKGYEMVDQAFKENPMDPNLTSEQRASIVKRHAAVRHRAAAFGRAKHLLTKERLAHEATKKKLAQYESTVPNRDGAKPNAELPGGRGSKMAAMEQRLLARAK